MQNLENQVAVITGATSGIGRATAKAFSQHGLRLMLHGRNEEQLAQIAGETGAQSVLGDITQADLPDRLLNATLERFGACDIVVNNAGMLETGMIEDIDIDRVCKMVRVNVEAVFRVAYTFARHFKSRDAGDLVNIGSVMGTKIRDTAGAYAGTKHAVEALSEGLRMELARTNVRVSCIEPGLVRTGLHRHYEIPVTEAVNVPSPLSPEEVADIIVFVLQQERHVRIPRLMVLPRGHVV